MPRNSPALPLVLALAGLLGPHPAQADPYDGLARQIALVSRRSGRSRLAVVPLRAASGGKSSAGEAISERLVSRLASFQDLQLVERTLLKPVLQEQTLGVQGWVEPAQAQKVGRILGVQALVTGTYLVSDGSQIEVHVRVIDPQTARVLGAAVARVPHEWKEELFLPGEVFNVPPPELGEFSVGSDAAFFRDAPGSGTCEAWEARVDQAQTASLDIEARYWATRMRDPAFSPSQLSSNPGAEIRSMSLRQSLYRRIQDLYDRGYGDGISHEEKGRLESAQLLAQNLTERCY